jgi:hypothetical protein
MLSMSASGIRDLVHLRFARRRGFGVGDHHHAAWSGLRIGLSVRCTLSDGADLSVRVTNDVTNETV